MDKIVLDANVFLKLITLESDSKLVEDLFITIFEKGVPVLEPNFVRVEIYSVVRRKVYFKELTYAQAEESLSIFRQMGNKYYRSSGKFLDLAYDLSFELNQPVIYDTLYLSLAILKNAYFVTQDLKFLKLSRKYYKDCYSVKELLLLLN